MMACSYCAPHQLDRIAQVDSLLNLSVKRIRWAGHQDTIANAVVDTIANAVVDTMANALVDAIANALADSNA